RRTPGIQHERLEQMSGDLTVLDDCRKLVRGMQYIFHAGGTVSAADTSGIGAMSAITLNLVLTAQTIQAAWEESVERILVFSSSTAYPEADHPIKEEEMWSGPPYHGYFGYAWLRRYTERLCEFAASKSKMKIAIVRPTAVYGPWDTSVHVIPSLVRRALAKPNPFVVWGTGEEVRDFLHVSDLARGCLLLLEKHAECDPVNIGYGSAVNIKQTVQTILHAAGHEKAKIVFDATKPGTIPFRMVDTSKARRLLGFEPKISLEDGLTDTVKWFQAHPDFVGPG
ncbi:MAG TPA: NAD-dependent epimerase/dehydratase family protein, partial [Candidatus Saccharimonadales bacterium]|nr:NAD-dependent epimerase/dehydratase family protein [Candidatus Saccharimonadales bacterium]